MKPFAQSDGSIVQARLGPFDISFDERTGFMKVGVFYAYFVSDWDHIGIDFV